MKATSRIACGLVAVAAGWTFVPVAAAVDEQAVEFLHALQRDKHGEMAIEFMRSLERNKEAPAELKEVWDLEMSKSLQVSAGEALGREAAEKRITESQVHLDKFLKDHPKHPEIGTAMMAWGIRDVEQGWRKLNEAKGAAEAADAAKLYTESREIFTKSKPRFQTAIDRFKDRVAEAQKAVDEKRDVVKPKAVRPKKAPKIDAVPQSVKDLFFAKLKFYEARLRLAIVDHNIGETYKEDKDPARVKALEAAAKGFDAIYQETRLDPEMAEATMRAHARHGNTAAELGRLDEAIDIFDECQGWDSGLASDELDQYFGEVESYRLNAIGKKDGAAKVIEQATLWLTERRERVPMAQRKNVEKSPGYQIVLLSLAKAKLALGEKEPKEAAAAIALLRDMEKINSPSQDEAIRLLGKAQNKAPVAFDDKEKNPAVALVKARDAAKARNWEIARQWYEHIATIAKNPKDKNDRDAAAAELPMIKVEMAKALLADGKPEEALTAAAALTKDVNSPAAESAAAVTIDCAKFMYKTAYDKARQKDRTQKDIEATQAALARLQKIATHVLETFPGKRVEGHARMALAAISYEQKQYDVALKAASEVNPNSPQYPDAMRLAAYIHWGKYLNEKRTKAEADRDKTELNNAIRCLKEATKGSTDLNIVLLYTDALVESGTPEHLKLAKEVIGPTIDKFKDEGSLDGNSLRAHVAAVRIHVLSHDFTEASKVAVSLIVKGEDGPAVNQSLVQFVKLVYGEVKRGEEAVLAATTNPDANVLDQAQKSLADRRRLLGGMLRELAKRERLQPDQLEYLAFLCREVDLVDPAIELLQRVQETTKDETTKIRVGAIRLSVLSKKGDYEDAIKQVDALIKAQPKALAPKTEKARILQSWAEATRSPQRFNEAVTEWIGLREQLKGYDQVGDAKTRAYMENEYYEANYNAAMCLLKQFEATKDKSKALDAYRALNSFYQINPALSGADMVTRYVALMAVARNAAGLPPPAAAAPAAAPAPAAAAPVQPAAAPAGAAQANKR